MKESKRKEKLRLVDRYYYLIERISKETLAQAEELMMSHHVLFRWKTFVLSGCFRLLAFLMSPNKSRFGVVFSFFKSIIGLTLLAISSLILLILVLLGGSLGAFIGLRNRGEYGLREQFAAWFLPMVLLTSCPFWLSDQSIHRISSIIVFTILLVGIDFLFGHCGIPTFGHAAFCTLGAYMATWLSKGMFGVSFSIFVAVILSGFFGAIVGVLLALPAIRIKDHQLTVVTLAFGLMIPMVLKVDKLSFFSGSHEGGLALAPLTPPEWLKWMRPETSKYFVILFFAVVLTTFAYNIIRHSQIGRAFQTIRCDVEIASVLGIPIFRLKVFAFALSAFYAAIAGGLFALRTGFVSPDSFTLQDAILYNIALMFGGMGSILGAVLGATFLNFEPDIGSKMASYIAQGSQLTYALTGAIIIIVMYFAPGGFAGLLAATFKNVNSRRIYRGINYISPPADYDVLRARGTPVSSHHLNEKKL